MVILCQTLPRMCGEAFQPVGADILGAGATGQRCQTTKTRQKT